MKIFITILAMCLLPLLVFAQSEESEKRPFELGLDFQMYPAGIMPGLKAEIGIGKYYKSSIEVRAGFNRARRRNWGEHGDERGGGFGASLGYRYYILKPMKGLYAVARNDFWGLTIDYRNIGADEEYDTADDTEFGQSNIFIVQPTAGLGYKFLLPIGGKLKMTVTPEIAAGWEVNVSTKAGSDEPQLGGTNGEEVGQGAIMLWGLNIAIAF